ncbi:FG-GAP repeat domain-containing protein [Streptosporangium sp. G11]|uniref:FG-GAP repeat domain-containing protein n=1 Tax=Streptosporangium sp. G11 TaxID=3436926 RepID=UPI003EC093C0
MIRRSAPVLALLLALTACEQAPQATAQRPAKAVAICDRATPRDFDGDGADDVAVGQRDGGSVHLLTRDRLAPITVPGAVPKDLGHAVALARMNDDKCADLIVGAPATPVNGVPSAGAVYIVYGGNAAPPLKIEAPHPTSYGSFGWSVAGYDGFLAIGAPAETVDGLWGGGAAYTGKPLQLRRIIQESPGIPGNSEEGDEFGSSVAIGPLWDGRVQLIVGAPGERTDGAGRQAMGEQDSLDAPGAVTVISDVRADELDASKHNGQGTCRVGQEVAYVPGAGGRWATVSGRCGLLQIWAHDGPWHTENCRACVRQDFDPDQDAALAAAPDGSLAVAWRDSVEIIPLEPRDKRSILFTGLWPVAFYGSRLVFGPSSGKNGVAIYDPATGKVKEVTSKSGGQVLG